MSNKTHDRGGGGQFTMTKLTTGEGEGGAGQFCISHAAGTTSID